MKHLTKSLTLFLMAMAMASMTFAGCTSASVQTPDREAEAVHHGLNINTADLDALQSLPGIGPQLALKIIEHRNRYGPFRKREHLLIVEGISEARYREVEKFLTTN